MWFLRLYSLLPFHDVESYATQRQLIQQVRTYINQVEARNEAAFQAYNQTEQDLQRRIREGREAE